MELYHLHRGLGYSGGGSWQAYRDKVFSGKRSIWGDYCKNNAGITDVTAQNYFKCSQVVLARLRNCSSVSNGNAVVLMETQPSKLTDVQRKTLIHHIVNQGLKDGETMTTLRREFAETRQSSPLVDETNPGGSISPEDFVAQALRLEAVGLGAGLKRTGARQLAMCMLLKDHINSDAVHGLILGWIR